MSKVVLIRALQQIHDRGVLHGDIRPQNVVVDDTGRPYIIDFAMSRQGADSGVLALEMEDFKTVLMLL